MRRLTDEEMNALAADYERDGFALVRALLTEDEVAPLAGALDAGGGSPGSFAVTDSQGEHQEAAVWTTLGDDLIGVVPRLEPIVAIAEHLIGEPVAHWHSKLSWKRPDSASRWDWHQDYGFWVDEGATRPAMCTIAVAVGEVSEANGCMRLVAGSHRLGTLALASVGQSRATDPDLVADARRDLATVPCELGPGDAVVFHANTLHGSGPNRSGTPRTMLMASYNAASNVPTAPLLPGHVPAPLEVLPASALVDGWTEVFGTTPMIDPVAAGATYDYEITTSRR